MKQNGQNLKSITHCFHVLITTILLFVFCSSSQAEEFEIKHADSLEADKNQISVTGNIIINYKDAVIEAPLGKIQTDNDGKLEKASFFGRAKIHLKDRSIEADKITILMPNKKILAEGKTLSELKDKKNNLIMIASDYQQLLWNGEDANAKGNLLATFQDTKITAEQAQIIYKNKKPYQAVFYGGSEPANLEQPTNKTSANEIIFDINTQNIQAFGDVKTAAWPDQTRSKDKQDLVLVSTENLLVDQDTGTITAKADVKTVKVSYQDTNGESQEAFLIKSNKDGKPEKIVFKGNANVSQPDKQISSEEVVFSFKDKKLTSNTKINKRPKTLIFKKE